MWPASGTAPSLPATTSHIKPATVNPILANIVGVGDSLTAGYGLPRDEAFPEALQWALRSAWVFGVAGWY